MPAPRVEDVWTQYPTATHTTATMAPVPQPASVEAQVVQLPVAAPAVWRESTAWLVGKHAAQLAFVAAVLVFVIHGGEQPAMALSYVAASLLLLGGVSLADRRRFLDDHARIEIVHVEQAREQALQRATQLAVVAATPSIVAMPARIDVT